MTLILGQVIRGYTDTDLTCVPFWIVTNQRLGYSTTRINYFHVCIQMILKFENISIYNLETRPSLPSISQCASGYSGSSLSKSVDFETNLKDSVALDIVN